MGCAMSASTEEEDDAVAVCRERKRLMKTAMGCRQALAHAHCNYYQSLRAVAMGIKLFVTRHSSPPSPFLLTTGPAKPDSEEEAHGGDDDGAEVCQHFCDDAVPLVSSSENQLGFGWDYFNPFDGLNQSCDDYLAGLLKKTEGVPRSEDHEQIQRNSGVKGVFGSSSNGRELFEALEMVEELFLRASESGEHVSRMLETKIFHFQSDFEEIKDSPHKIGPSMSWRALSRSSSFSCKSLLASTPRSSSVSTDFDELGGMVSGSHSLTMERLYAWEKKLYEEVKVGNSMRKLYEQKCLLLKNPEARKKGSISAEKSEAEIRELHCRILVTVRRVETIFQRIQKLRDEELQPQVMELVHGLMSTWKTMGESHKAQKQAIFDARVFNSPKFCNESHRLATFQLGAELQNWRSCFSEYISSQKAYVEALDGWLSKFIDTQPQFFNGRPPLFTIYHSWLTSIHNLPFKLVIYAMKGFEKDVRNLWAQEGEEQQQKRKTDAIAEELERKVVEFKKAEARIMDSKPSRHKMESNGRLLGEYVAKRKDSLDATRKRLEMEKLKHLETIEEAQRLALHGFQVGFSSVFESLAEWSRASVQMYADLKQPLAKGGMQIASGMSVVR